MRTVERQLAELPIVEAFGGPEFFVHGTKAVFIGDEVQIICYIERQIGDTIERHELLRVHMTRARYEANLLKAFARFSENDPAGACHRCLVRGSESEH